MQIKTASGPELKRIKKIIRARDVELCAVAEVSTSTLHKLFSGDSTVEPENLEKVRMAFESVRRKLLADLSSLAG